MQILRESDSLCDFTLATIDGLAEEKVHKVVLAASSDFFERLFKHENAASCLDVACRGPVLKHIVDFIYSGVISGPNEDLLEIYRTAHFMLLDRLCEKWVRGKEGRRRWSKRACNWCRIEFLNEIKVNWSISKLKVQDWMQQAHRVIKSSSGNFVFFIRGYKVFFYKILALF